VKKKKKKKEKKGECLVLGNDDGEIVKMKNVGDDELRVVLVTGQPLKEPIVKRGGFVMNTQEEITQAMHDYQMGRF